MQQKNRRLNLKESTAASEIVGESFQTSIFFQLTDMFGTYICLQHAVVFLLSTQGFLQNADMSLIVLMLLLQGLHLRGHGEDILVPSGDFGPELVDLKAGKEAEPKSWEREFGRSQEKAEGEWVKTKSEGRINRWDREKEIGQRVVSR